MTRAKDLRWRDIIWHTREGERIRLRDMEDDHLLASISFLDRRVREIANLSCNKAMENSIQAVLYHEMGVQHHLDYPGAVQKALLREASFRGLSRGTFAKVGEKVIIDLRPAGVVHPGILK